ncbi:MAG: YeeE/YedE family protein [Bdellovibrio sp. CG10_big_fil_rev_8_21_14_0_10_47_8]|nr:MAG: YeeE/YedE family protein [Bdellovibrio sp. CG10_big_fil_rev_8_21_14_0_10_47_8]
MSPWMWSLVGGLMIGISASILLVFNGRVSGISGILNNTIFFKHDSPWRAVFLGGLLLGGLVLHLSGFNPLEAEPIYKDHENLVLAGLLVGFGTALGSGCTSGHGICGLSRGSPRSLMAVVVFMLSGFLIATLTSVVMRSL